MRTIKDVPLGVIKKIKIKLKYTKAHESSSLTLQGSHIILKYIYMHRIVNNNRYETIHSGSNNVSSDK